MAQPFALKSIVAPAHEISAVLLSASVGVQLDLPCVVPISQSSGCGWAGRGDD
jgi:hypothetical protein